MCYKNYFIRGLVPRQLLRVWYQNLCQILICQMLSSIGLEIADYPIIDWNMLFLTRLSHFNVILHEHYYWDVSLKITAVC